MRFESIVDEAQGVAVGEALRPKPGLWFVLCRCASQEISPDMKRPHSQHLGCHSLRGRVKCCWLMATVLAATLTAHGSALATPSTAAQLSSAAGGCDNLHGVADFRHPS